MDNSDIGSTGGYPNEDDKKGTLFLRTSAQKDRAGPGIFATHISAAREMTALHTKGRRPNLQVGNNRQTTPQIQLQQITNRPSAEDMMSTAFFKPRLPAFNHGLGNKIRVPAQKGSSHKACSNPQCSECGAVVIPGPQSSIPVNDTPSISINDWEIYTTRKPILNSEELEALESTLNFPNPEMIFGNNKVEVYNPILNWGLKIDAIDSLKLVKTNIDPEELIKVHYANDWYKARQQKHQQQKYNDDNTNILEYHKPFDWTYTTEYKGTEYDTNAIHFIRDDTKEIPLDKLTQRVPILFFQEFVLFEDELGDNGISMLTVKIRCMEHCMLILSRFFLRVDNVLFRIYDTRLYIDFEENLVIREFKRQEDSYDIVNAKINPGVGDPRSLMRDSNWCSQNLKVISTEREYVQL